MQYFFKKNSSKKENRRKKYIIFRITSHKDISAELILKISKIINANPCADIFEKNLSYNAIFYRAGINSPWSSKTKDILDSCLRFTSYQIDKFTLIEHDKYKSALEPITYDPMTEILLSSNKLIKQYLNQNQKIKKTTFKNISIKNIKLVNKKMGLAMSDPEIIYLENMYKKLKRNPTDVELMMFSQINSEHCRHKIFNSDFYIDNNKMKNIYVN